MLYCSVQLILHVCFCMFVCDIWLYCLHINDQFVILSVTLIGD